MKMHPLFIAALLALAPLVSSVGLGQSDIQDPSWRQASLDLGKRLIAPQPNPAASLPADMVDPFNPARPAHASSAKPGGEGAHRVSGSASAYETLEKIAAGIKPSGVVVMGGEPLLLIREKKLKVGDTLTITFEGADYTLVVTEIDRTSFKLRLDNEEITRPIK